MKIGAKGLAWQWKAHEMHVNSVCIGKPLSESGLWVEIHSSHLGIDVESRALRGETVGSTAQRDSIGFGNFRLDIRSQELRKAGELVRLPNQSFRVLAMLASRPGELVTREEIQQTIWGGATFVDFEQGLNHCVKHIRAALNDDAQNPRFVETLPKRGYRFIAPVKSAEIQQTPEIVLPAPSKVVQRSTKRPYVLAAVVFGLVVLTAGIWWTRTRKAAGRAVVAVLPFNNMTGDPAQDYFSDGMAEELSAQLARINPEQLAVISRTSAFKFKGSKSAADQIGRELGANYLLEGSVRGAGNRVRITAQLIRTADQRHVWSESYDRDVGSVLQLEREVAEQIADAIRVKVSSSAAGSRYAPDWQAYSAYLKGRHLLLDTKTEGDVRLAIQYFEEATHIDPKFALAHSGLADGYMEQAGLAVAPDEAYAKARQAVNHALEIDPQLAEGHVSLGRIAHYADWDVAKAEREFRSAIALKPQYEEGYHSYSHLLVYLGRFDEAIEQSESLLKLDPLSPHMNAHLGLMYMLAGRLDEALTQLNRTIADNPGYIRAYHFLGVTYELKGDYKHAVETLTKAGALRAGSTETVADLIHALSLDGRSQEARRLLSGLEMQRRTKFIPYSDLAVAYLGLGERERALSALNRAVETKEFMVTLNVEPRFAPLKDEPRFKDLVKRSGLTR